MNAMKKILYAIVPIFAILSFAVGHGEVVDRIVVVVNNEVITQSEIDRILESIYEQYRGLYYGDELIKKLDEVRHKVLEQLMDDRLILSEAKKQNVEVNESEVDVRIDEMARHFPSKAVFERAISQQNMSIRDLRKRHREQLMVRKLIDRKIGSTIMVSPVEINDYYTKHINDYIRTETIALSNILIRPKNDMDAGDAGNLAKDILNKLKAGGDFSELAKKYSEGPNAAEGGSMGYVKKGDLLPDIESVVFNMKEGEVSDIIQTKLGYHIFKVDERRARQTLELAEVKREVEDAIYREKVKDKIKDWVGNLKKNAYISFK